MAAAAVTTQEPHHAVTTSPETAAAPAPPASQAAQAAPPSSQEASAPPAAEGARVIPLRPRNVEEPSSAPPPAPPPAPSKGISDDELENAYRRCVRLLDELEELLDKLKQDAAASARDLVAAYKELREAITLLARLTRELGPEREIVILQSPKWRAIEAAIIRAVTPYPEAAMAIAAALQELEAA